MRTDLICLPIILLALTVMACGSGEPPPEQENKSHPLWQTQLDALERAKGVEDMVKANAEQRRRQIDEIESK